MKPQEIQALSERMKQNIRKVILGKDEMIERVVLCCFCQGHILLEDVPGTGKTTLAKALAKSLDCQFRRVQFTPDLLPSDVTGINFYNQKQEDFVFKKGAVFSDLLLADEINRATPRTQSSLLECMEERQVTIDGITYPMSEVFLVIATQNPIETQGTFPLPEAQMDRFFMQLSVGYPNAQSEHEMLDQYQQTKPLASLTAVITPAELVVAQKSVCEILVNASVKDYIVALANATRTHEKIRLGISPRGTLALMRAAQCYAAFQGREYVIPDDVKAVAIDVFRHRILCKRSNLLTQTNEAELVLQEILSSVPVPIE